MKPRNGEKMKQVIVFIVITSSLLLSQQSNISNNTTGISTINNCFIENSGQWNNDVLFLAKSNGMKAWITTFGVVYDYYTITANSLFNANSLAEENGMENYRLKGHTFAIRYIDASNRIEAVTADKQKYYYNYFINNNRGVNVPLYEEVIIENIYDGIDIRYYFDGGYLRYDFKVAAGADINSIKMSIEGIGSLEVNSENELIIATSLGEVCHGNILAFQNSWYGLKPVECGYAFDGEGNITFTTSGFNQVKPLIIDPLVFSTFSGGSNLDKAVAITTDDDDNLYIAGWTFSDDYPATFGAYDRSYNGDHDVFVSKFNSDGSALIYSTYIGTGGTEYVKDIAVDASGNVIITGGTMGTAYPTTPGAYDETFNGARDIYVTKFNSTGSALLYSTFIGGADWDNAEALGIDDAGNVYITGITWSTDYPTSAGAFDRTHNGGRDDAFLTKLNSSGSAIIFSSYLGGNNYDNAFDIVIDDNKAVITGYTVSPDFPTTAGVYDPTHNNGKDVFITKFNATGSSLLYSTYLGGNAGEEAYGIDINPSGWVIVTGYTNSIDFPTTASAYDGTYNTGDDVFIAILSSTASGLLYGTFLGGGNSECGNAVAYDNTGSFCVTGKTTSTTFPTTSGCFDDSYNGLGDAFISKFNSGGNVLIYSTYLGGSNSDIANDFFLIADKDAVITGETHSTDFPVTGGGYDQTHNGNSDAFISQMKMTAVIPTIILNAPNGGENWRAGSVENITWTATDVAMVTIEYSTDNGTSWTSVATTTASSASFGWTVPDTPSEQCLVRISDAANPAIYDESSSTFTIFVPGLTLTSPNGGENWQAGTTQQITWNANHITVVLIEYSTNNGFNWINIASSVPAGDGNYDWVVPNTPSDQCKVKITDTDEPSRFDESFGTFVIDPTSDVSDAAIPNDYKLYQNYPNPFNPSTKIYYDIPKADEVNLAIFDIQGNEVAAYSINHTSPGRYYIEFDGSGLSSGIYFCSMKTEQYASVHKMILLK